MILNRLFHRLLKRRFINPTLIEYLSTKGFFLVCIQTISLIPSAIINYYLVSILPRTQLAPIGM